MGGSNLMSAIAGRVLLIPKGNYDSTATYTMLDMVVYNGSSYICKQECTGVVPTNTTYWMLNASGSAVAYINDIGDVVITNPTNKQVLMYNSTTQKWVNGTLKLNQLNDTQFASLSDGQVLKYNATSQKWENADEAGGILPHLIVISETGSTVTATKGQTVITATETSTGHFECDLPEFGTWTIDAILGGDDAQVSLVVDTVKVYTVDDSHFHATVTVKYPDGATCRLQSADETLYATGSPYTFTVHHAETYTITVTYNQRIYTDTVTFTTEGQSFSKTLPSPSEVDANNINLWLFFGDVSGTFSTLADILGNSTALSMLMASTDAVDYLVRCKEWIGKGLVPIMTSNTIPSGVASASSEASTARQAWKGFAGESANGWMPSETSYPAWIQYKFDAPTLATNLKALYKNDSGSSYTQKVEISASNDGTNWTTLATNISLNNHNTYTDISFTNDNEYLYYRMTLLSGSDAPQPLVGSGYLLQFYSIEGVINNQSAMSYIGLNNYCTNTLLADTDWRDGISKSEYLESVLNVKIPTMTSATTPSGECFASSRYGTDQTYLAFHVFDKNETSKWYPAVASSTAGQYVGYKYPESKNGQTFDLVFSSSGVASIVKIQGSNDGTNYVDLTGNINIPITASTTDTYKFKQAFTKNVGNYQYYRIYIVQSTSTQQGYGFMCDELQIYGREDV